MLFLCYFPIISRILFLKELKIVPIIKTSSYFFNIYKNLHGTKSQTLTGFFFSIFSWELCIFLITLSRSFSWNSWYCDKMKILFFTIWWLLSAKTNFLLCQSKLIHYTEPNIHLLLTLRWKCFFNVNPLVLQYINIVYLKANSIS